MSFVHLLQLVSCIFPAKRAIQADFLHFPHFIPKFGQPPVQHGAVHHGGADAVMFGVGGEDLLVGGERGFGEVVARAVTDAEGEADFVTASEAKAGIVQMLLQAEVGGAGEGHGAGFGGEDAVQGKVARVVVAVEAHDEVGRGTLLDKGKWHDARGFALFFLVLVINFQPAVLVKRAADGVEDGIVDRRGQERLRGRDDGDFVQPLLFGCGDGAVFAQGTFRLFEEGGKGAVDVGGQQTLQLAIGEEE